MGNSRPPLNIDADGMIEVPKAPGDDGSWLAFVHMGARMAAWPLPNGDGGILLIRGGIADDPAYEPDMLAVSMSAEGLLYLSSDINQLVFELHGNAPASPPDRPSLPGDVVNTLIAASHALRSYQHGNSAPDLASSIAELLDQTLERFGHPRTSAAIDIRKVI